MLKKYLKWATYLANALGLLIIFFGLINYPPSSRIDLMNKIMTTGGGGMVSFKYPGVSKLINDFLKLGNFQYKDISSDKIKGLVVTGVFAGNSIISGHIFIVTNNGHGIKLCTTKELEDWAKDDKSRDWLGFWILFFGMLAGWGIDCLDYYGNRKIEN